MENANKMLLVKQYLRNVKDHAVSPSGFAGHLVEKYGTDIIDEAGNIIKGKLNGLNFFPENNSQQPLR